MVMSFLQHYRELVAYLALGLSIVVFVWQWHITRSERKRCLVIVQRQAAFMNTVEQLDGGLTRFIFFVTIINNSFRTPVIIRYYHLKLPWPEEQFTWLTDPAEVEESEQAYGFDKDQSFPRDRVLNHRVYGEWRLAPGDVIEGFLLATGFAPIPNDYKNGQTIEMRFSVIDQDLKYHSTKCEFKISRMP